MAVTAALSTFFSLLSIFCGAAALALPVIALVRRKNAPAFAAASMGLCAISLLGQIFEYNNRVNVQDWSALLDTS